MMQELKLISMLSSNTKRLHSSLFYLTPEDFLFDRVEDRLLKRQNKLNEAKQNRTNFREAC